MALTTRAINGLYYLVFPWRSARSYPYAVWQKYRSEWVPEPAAVAKLTASEIAESPNMGAVTLANIRAWLAEHGLQLSGETDGFCKCCGQAIIYLKPQAAMCSDSGANGKTAPDAGAPVITAEMIDAGRDALADYDPGWTNEAEIVSQIFSAMRRLLPQ